MKIDWNEYLDHQLNVTLEESYGVVYGNKKDDEPPFYEIVFKSGKLIKVFEEGLLLEGVRDGQLFKTFIPHRFIKSVDIF